MGEASRASGGEEGEGEAGGGTPRSPAQCACARAGTSSGLARAWLLKIAPVWGSVRGGPGESRAEGGRRLRATRCWRRVLAAACARLPAAWGHGVAFCEKVTKKKFLQGSYLSALFVDTSFLILQKISAVALGLEAAVTEAVYDALGY